MKVFITTYGAYTYGKQYTHGRNTGWLDVAAMDFDDVVTEFEERMVSMGYGDDLLVTDYEGVGPLEDRIESMVNLRREDLTEFANTYEALSESEKHALDFLCDQYDDCPTDLIERVDEVYIWQGTAIDYAYEFIDSTGSLEGVPEYVARYFDYDGFAHDLEVGGDICEIAPDVYVINPHDF